MTIKDVIEFSREITIERNFVLYITVTKKDEKKQYTRYGIRFPGNNDVIYLDTMQIAFLQQALKTGVDWAIEKQLEIEER